MLGIYNRSSYFAFGYTGLITLSSRNHAYMPNRGSLVRLKFTNFNAQMASDYDFHSLDIDVRKYLEL